MTKVVEAAAKQIKTPARGGMLNRVSVNALLKSVIVIMSASAVVVLSSTAWQNWKRLGAVKRIEVVADVSGDLFTALHNLRVDRATTFRTLNSEQQHASLPEQLKDVRAGDMPALKSALQKFSAAKLPGTESLVSRLNEAVSKLVALQQQTATVMAQPKASRPQGLAKEYFDETTALMGLLDTISTHLTNSVKLEDSYIDQLMELKQLAWMARNAAGDASVVISNSLSGLPLPPDPMTKYLINVAKVDATWGALEDLASGLPVPARFKAALAEAKNGFMGADYTQLRLATLKKLIAGEKINTSAEAWSTMSVGKLASVLNVAIAALEAAKDHAAVEHAEAVRQLLITSALLVVAFLIGFVMMFVVTRRVTAPLRELQQGMLKIAAGDFSVVLPGLERKDEIGDVANAVERFKVLADEKARGEAEAAMQRQQAEAAREKQAAEVEAAVQAKAAAERAKATEEQTRAVQALGVGLRNLASGDLTFRLGHEVPDAYKDLRNDFNGTMDQLGETIRSLIESTGEVTNASAEISTSTTDLSQRTEEQAASLEETSASMEEIAATVKKNAENAQVANQSANTTREVADRSGQVVAQAVEAMARIEESSRKISDIIGVIDEIARQTNLLALNAAVEAARAGEAGRGFAVVASEVRSLAQRSSQAAKDIKDLITNSNGQVKDGVDLVNKAGAALTEIVESIKAVGAIVADIAHASSEQATGIEQVNKALTQMDEVTQQNSALVEENAATAKTLENQARAMDERVSFFKFNSANQERAGGKSAAQPAAPSRAAPAAPLRGPAAKQQHAPAPKRPAPAVGSGGPARRMQTALATAIDSDPDWKEF